FSCSDRSARSSGVNSQVLVSGSYNRKVSPQGSRCTPSIWLAIFHDKHIWRHMIAFVARHLIYQQIAREINHRISGKLEFELQGLNASVAFSRPPPTSQDPSSRLAAAVP